VSHATNPYPRWSFDDNRRVGFEFASSRCPPKEAAEEVAARPVAGRVANARFSLTSTGRLRFQGGRARAGRRRCFLVVTTIFPDDTSAREARRGTMTSVPDPAAIASSSSGSGCARRAPEP